MAGQEDHKVRDDVPPKSVDVATASSTKSAINPPDDVDFEHFNKLSDMLLRAAGLLGISAAMFLACEQLAIADVPPDSLLLNGVHFLGAIFSFVLSLMFLTLVFHT